MIILSRQLQSTKGGARQICWNGRDLGDWATELEGARAIKPRRAERQLPLPCREPRFHLPFSTWVNGGHLPLLTPIWWVKYGVTPATDSVFPLPP